MITRSHSGTKTRISYRLTHIFGAFLYTFWRDSMVNNSINHAFYSLIGIIRGFHTDLFKVRFYSVLQLETVPKWYQNGTEFPYQQHTKLTNCGVSIIMRL